MKDLSTEKSNDIKLQSKIQVINPYIYLRPSVSSVTIRILILLSIQVLALFLTKSYLSVVIVLCAVLGALVTVALNYLIYHEPLFQSIGIITQGILIGLLLPNTYPPVSAFFISFVALFISRSVIFKSINCWVNIPALAVISAWFIGKNYFPSFSITSDLIPLRNSSVYLIQNGTFKIFDFDSTITNFLNSHIFNMFSVTIPEGFISVLWDTGSIIPAFRFNILTILSSIVLFSDNAFSGIIPVLFLFVYGTLVRVFGTCLFGGSFNQGDIILAMLTSGTLFCATFLIQWFGTVPINASGKIILGITSGLLAFLIMGCGTSPVGMVFTLLITNIINMIIRNFEENNAYSSTATVISKLLSKGEN